VSVLSGVFLLLIILFLFRFVLKPLTSSIKIVTFTGPSGVGKTTIVKELLRRHSDWGMVLSQTSRETRDTDLPGEYKCNVSKKEFLRMRKEGRDLWIETAHGNTYATLAADVLQALLSKGLSLMQILHTSVIKIHAYAPGKVLSIFILPPSEEEMRRRLINRGDSPEQVERRISDCKKWEEEARASDISYEFIRNDRTVAEAVETIEDVIESRM